MVETGGSGESVEGNGRIYFGGGKGAAAAGIRKTLREQSGVRGGEHEQRRVGARPGTSV